mmetsp:Transcript_61332/g.150126  ORF Transcript_61332/g.150126 Transcript_61332/m.150126 type:complete len:91 (-) Transcript_61332:2247-2519(-)
MITTTGCTALIWQTNSSLHSNQSLDAPRVTHLHAQIIASNLLHYHIQNNRRRDKARRLAAEFNHNAQIQHGDICCFFRSSSFSLCLVGAR